MFGLVRKKKYNELLLAYEEAQKNLLIQEAIVEEFKALNESFVERYHETSAYKNLKLKELDKRWNELIMPTLEGDK